MQKRLFRVYLSLAESKIGLPSLSTPASSQEKKVAPMIAMHWGLEREVNHFQNNGEELILGVFQSFFPMPFNNQQNGINFWWPRILLVFSTGDVQCFIYGKCIQILGPVVYHSHSLFKIHHLRWWERPSKCSRNTHPAKRETTAGVTTSSYTLLGKTSLWIFFLNFIYLFMAVLGLHFCARAFSSFSKWGSLFIAVCGPLTIAASLVAEHRLQTRRLSSCGSWA